MSLKELQEIEFQLAGGWPVVIGKLIVYATGCFFAGIIFHFGWGLIK